MKKHHALLILLLVGSAAFLLNETRNLKGGEAIVSEELKLLREAVKKSPGVAASTLAGRSKRPPVVEASEFTAGLAEILKGGSSAESRQRMQDFLKIHVPQLNSAPLARLKEICDLLEKTFPFDHAETEEAQLVWYGVVGLAAKYDPAWAFAKFEQAASTTKVPIHTQLGIFKNPPAEEGETMGLAYAGALQKWLDAAQATGRIEGTDPLVTELRADINAAQGNQSAAVKQISLLPYQSQRKAAIDHVKSLQTPEARRQAMEELSTALDIENFRSFMMTLADQQGFDAAREILGSASLTPEKHDLAAASIAAAKIGPHTKERAAWLLDNLQSGDARGLDLFTGTWTQGNYADVANWITSLPNGQQRDAALKGFIPVAARVDGATAMDWALTVSDPLLRNRLYCEAHENWKETDAEQANEYHDAHPLDREALEAASK